MPFGVWSMLKVQQALEPLPGKTMKRRLPKSFFNTTSFIGLAISLTAFALIIFLYVLELFAKIDNPYTGLISFIVLPVFLLFGVFVSCVGAIRTARRARKGVEEGDLPVLDFNKPRHRNGFTFVLVGGIFLAAISGFGSYQAYEYTESVGFCGTACHDVMKPEYVAYQASPHARVACVQCHIGAGTTWYVKSKLSGAYQVYSTLLNKYERPIKTPVENLRPARETCEQCHWPSHFYSQKLMDRTYYLSDEQNTSFKTSMLLKIGGREQGATEGIHAHMYLDNEVSYISTDRQRQDIPYVESRTKDGKVTIFQSTESPLTPDQIKNGKRRLVDCIDCHNRPSHQYNHPATSVNRAMAKGVIDAGLPEIKMVAVESLEKPYKTESEALSTIEKDILAYYKENHPKTVADKGSFLTAAIKEIKTIYQHNYFPEMKTDWRGFPNNIDHLHSKGCFRCHDDKHVSSTGKVISKDCQTCHTILSQKGSDGKGRVSLSGVPFEHPVDVGDAWKTDLCLTCHGKQEE